MAHCRYFPLSVIFVPLLTVGRVAASLAVLEGLASGE